MQSKHTAAAIIVSFMIIVSITPSLAFAQEESTDENIVVPRPGIITSILSDQVVLLAVAITIIGVGLKAICAILKHGRKEYDYRMTAVSMILGFLVSLQLVSTSIEHLPVDGTSTTHLIIIIGEILTVMGVDSGAKAVGQKLGMARSTVTATAQTSTSTNNGGATGQ